MPAIILKDLLINEKILITLNQYLAFERRKLHTACCIFPSCLSLASVLSRRQMADTQNNS